METLKLETWQPEPYGRIGCASAGCLDATMGALGARGLRDRHYVDLLMSQLETVPQVPKPQGSISSNGPVWWQRSLERVKGPTSQAPVKNVEVLGDSDRTLSTAALRDDAVSTDSALLRVEAPGQSPAPNRTSKQGEGPLEGGGPLVHWGTARLRCTPGREQVRLCELGSVKNGWLPIHKRALVFGLPLHASNPENLPSQPKIDTYISITTPKGYEKKWNGIRHTNENLVEKCAQPMGFRAWRNQSHSGINQESSSSDSACPNGYLQSGGDGERRGREGRGRICWPPLHSCSVQADGGVLRCRGSPLQRTTSAPGPQGVSAASAKTKSKNMPVVKTGFSSITITARRVPQTAGLPSREDLEPDPVTQATGPSPQDGSSVTLAGDLLSQSWSPTPQTSGHVIKAGGTCDQAWGFTTQHRGTVAQAIGLVTQDGNPVTEASKMHPAVATGSTTMKPPQAATDHVPVIRRRKPVIVKVTEYQQTYCPGERAAGTRPPEFRHSYSEGESKESTFSGKFQPQGRRDPTSGMFRSCAQMEIPAGSSNSVLYLDKCLSVSLEEPESRKEVHRSTLSLYLGGSSPTEDQRRREEADGPHLPLSCSSMFLDPDPILAGGTALVQKQCCQRLPLKPDPSCVSERPSGSKAHSHTYGSPPGDACRLATKAVRCGGKSDGQSSFGLEHPVCSKPQENVIQKSPEGILTQGPASVTADVKVQRQRNNTPKSTAAKHTKTPSDTVKARVEDVGNHLKNLRSEREVLRGPYCAGRPASEHGPSGPLRKASSWVAPFNESQDSTTKPLTLREALELFRPDFISRSQGRVRELEQRTQKRRAMQDSGLDLEPTRGRRRRNCTKPHPLSDNLFRPRERSISGKEMQRHSRRIYNKLPEVTRKKEEEKKKVLSQTNRLRAELFKKKLLDQILQRNTD